MTTLSALQDPEEAIETLIEGAAWEEALRLVRNHDDGVRRNHSNSVANSN